ncbi:MAG: L,D-transpeptidase [Nitrospirales bacterium]
MEDQGSGRTRAKRLSCWLGTGALLLVSPLLIFWWRSPVLPHTFPTAVERLDRQIWTAGGADMLPDQYAAFHQKVSDIRQHWRVETNRWWTSWPLEAFTESYQQLMHSGATLLTAVEKKKISHQNRLKDLLKEEQSQLARLRRLNGLFDLRGKRTTLSRAESFLSQGLTQLAQGQLDPVPRLLSQAQDAMQPVEVLLIRQMSRYTNGQKIAQWKRWVEDTVERSRQMGGLTIVVIKASQEFRLYQNGILRQNYPANLGFSGLQDKLYEGDGATPEGLFRIVQKKREGETQFHKAFMLDFPTPLHQHQFQIAKAKGLVPANRRIGGLIEIHGQWPGQRDVTNGCVSLDNTIMNKVFPLVSVNTPVVIVGALNPTNSVSAALAPILHHHLHRQSFALPSPITVSRPPDI